MSIDQPEAQRHTGDEGEGEWDDRPNAEDSAYELPESIPLDHSHPLLDPTQTQDFSPDAFLLSRRPASDLGSISKDLDLYGAQLREELVALINEDYADFVALGR